MKSESEQKQQDAVEQLQAWESTERVRPPWVPIKHGKIVKPPNDQANPQPLTDEMVLQLRAEPIGNSAAPPLRGLGADHGASETTRSKQIHDPATGTGI